MFDFFDIPSIKGKVGEGVVDFMSTIALDDNIYKRLSNVTLPLKNGGTTQIDHIIISIYGIFVIETKNYRGLIFGSPEQEYWTQATYSGKYSFKNPLKQNAYHVNILASLLNLPENFFYSVIAFIGDSELMTAMPSNVLAGDFFAYILKQQQIHFDQTQVHAVVQQIQQLRLQNGSKTDKKHNEYVKQKIDNPTCPKCRSKMVKRVVKSGKNKGSEFLGCSRFPQCRGTKKIVNSLSAEQQLQKEMEYIIKSLL